MSEKSEKTPQNSLRDLVQPSTAGADLTNAHPKNDEETCAQRVITSSADLPRRAIDPNSKAFDFKTEKQAFCLVNMAHTHQKCKSDTAALRILGCFPSREKAVAHSTHMDSKLDIFVLETHSWWPIGRHPTTAENMEEMQQKTVRKVEEYISSSANNKDKLLEQATDEKAEERHESANALWETGESLQQALDESSGGSGVCDTVEIVSRQHELRGQTYAVISIVGEPEMNDEPVINVLRAFETKDDARDYLRNTVHSEEVVTNCYVVAMYEWVAPVLVFTKKFFDNVESNFTHSQLEEIHHGKRAERKKIEKLLASRGKTMDDVDAFMDQLEKERADGEEGTQEEGEGTQEEQAVSASQESEQ